MGSVLSPLPVLPFMSLLHPNLTTHSFIFLLFFLCRASIVQKRIIYFQDEGSLTKRMCEKGRFLLLTLNNWPNFLFLQSPCWQPTNLFLSLLFSFILDFDAAAFLYGVILWHVNDCKWVWSFGCAWHWMPHWATDQTYHASHLPFPHAPLSSSLQLPTFLNYLSLVWWAPLSCPPYNNEQFLYAYLMVVSFFLSPPHSSFLYRILVWRRYR